MSADQVRFSTAGFDAYRATREAFYPQNAPHNFDAEWRLLRESQRLDYERLGTALRAPLEKENRDLHLAVAGLTGHIIPVQLDYVNHEGVRSIRHVRPITVTYGSSVWHPELGFVMPCWDMDKGAFRVYSLAGIRAWNGFEIKTPEIDRDKLEAENLKLREELAAMGQRYADAVRGRSEFRNAFREMREAVKKARAVIEADSEASGGHAATVGVDMGSGPSIGAYSLIGGKAIPDPDFREVDEEKDPDHWPIQAYLAWTATMGFSSADWRGLTDTQKAAWRAVADNVARR